MTSHPTTLSIPSASLTLYPSLPPCCSADLGLLRFPAGPVQLVPGCISWLIARHVFIPLRHWFRLQSPVVPDMLTSLEVMSETSPSLSDLLQVEDAVESVLAKRDLSPNSCNEGHALLDELLRDVNHPNHSPSVLFICSPLWLSHKEGHVFPSASRRFNLGRGVKHSLNERSFSACARFWYTWHWWRLSVPCVIKLKSEAHKIPPGPQDSGPMHINYARSRMAYDK